MRIPRSACLFHEKLARDTSGGAVLNLLQPTRRWFSPPPLTEPFDLPRVVIDLDAFDSPHVRVAEDQKETLKPLIAPNHWRQITSRPVRTVRQEPDFPRKFAVTSPLVLRYALLGEALPTAKDAWYRDFIEANTRMSNDMPEVKMKDLVNYFSTDPVENLKLQGFTNTAKKRLPFALSAHCFDFYRLRWIVSLLSTTKEGCQFLLRNDNTITRSVHIYLEGLRKTRTAGGGNIDLENVKMTATYARQRTAILIFLNNLIKSIKSQDLVPGAILSSLALSISAERCLLPAVKNHLSNYKLSRDKLKNRDFISALKSLQKAYVYDIEMNIMPWKDNKWHKRELLKLITGWRLGDRREAETPRELSFALLIPPETSLYSDYIIGLGEMGLANAIWVEWQALTKVGVPGQYSFNVQLFTIAFLLAKSPEFASKVLDSVQQDARPAETDISLHTRQLILEHYQFHNLSPSQALQDKVALTCSKLESLTKTIKTEALRSLENVLAINIAQKSGGNGMDLDWRRIGNGDQARMGLVATHSAQSTPVYEKPEGTRIEAPRS
jgi:hypothetical protein